MCSIYDKSEKDVEVKSSGFSVSANKAILFARCPNMVESFPVLERYPHEVLEKVIYYLYTNTASFYNVDLFSVVDVLYLATHLELPHLAYLCQKHMLDAMNKGSFFSIYEFCYPRIIYFGVFFNGLFAKIHHRESL